MSPYPDYRQPCGWNSLLPVRQPSRPLDVDVVCDAAVIGVGYTGLAIARRMAELEPQATIVMLDASEVGEGNPGRNSGFLLEIALANDAEPGQVARMKACNALISQAMADLQVLVSKYAIDCDLLRTGTWRAAGGGAGVKALRRYRAFLEAAQLPYEVFDRFGLHVRLGTAFYREGLYSPHCYTVQPAALARGLASNLPASIAIYENSAVIAIERVRRRWLAKTSRGTVQATRLFIANNAFCKPLGIAASRLVAMYTSAALTRPLSRRVIDSLGSEPNWGLLPAHRLGSTLRRTADGRLLIRSLYGYEREMDSRLVALKLEESLRRRFPQLERPVFESVWSGATGFTLNGAPVWGEYGPGLFVSVGCNGGGVVKGTLFGKSLAELACGRDTPNITALFGQASWMPPEPLRRLGFGALSRVERYKGRAEV